MRIESFANGAYTSQSLNADSERTVNWYPEQMESPGAKTQAVLYPCPGFDPYIDLSPGPIRGAFSQNGRTFFVSGYNLWEVDTTPTATLRGTVAMDANPATICSNGDGGNQLFITSGDVGYCYDLLTNTLTTELASGATMGAYLDTYFIAFDASNSAFYISDQYDGTTWDPTQFAQRTLAGDNWVGMQVVNSDLWLMGSQTSEAWYDAGTSPFPFAPRPGMLLQQGAASAFSLGQMNNVLIWLSRNAQGAGMVFRLDGYQPLRISTHAIEYAIQGYDIISDATCFVYQEQGHAFYVLTFPNAKATWVWDAATGLWHERPYWNDRTGEEEAMRVATFCHTVQNLNLVGDRVTGQVYVMSINTPTDVDGEGMRRVRRFRAMSSEEAYLFYSNLQIDMETGLGTSSGQGYDPELMLRWSNDSGHHWSNEITTGVGQTGEYGTRAMFRGNLGRARNRVFEITATDPIPWRMLQAFVQVERGTW